MKNVDRRTLAYLPSFLAVPISFFGIVFGWFAFEHFLASRKVSRLLRAHEKLFAKRLTDPKVHSLRISQDASDRGTLVIHFDVDDRATYEMLEADPDGIWSLRFPPRWETTTKTSDTRICQ